jgi:hypothetical protein
MKASLTLKAVFEETPESVIYACRRNYRGKIVGRKHWKR